MQPRIRAATGRTARNTLENVLNRVPTIVCCRPARSYHVGSDKVDAIGKGPLTAQRSFQMSNGVITP
jgi:hypothetical protein